MQAAQVLGGYSLGGADLLRRAMGKKKAEEMAEHRADLPRRRGEEAASRPQVADEVFDLMEKFAGYGFNKSHAAAYSLLAYHTAWIKVHCTAEFFAANMTVEIDDTDKLQVLLDRRQDLRHRGRRRPTSTAACYRFEPVDATRSCSTAWARSRARGRARSRRSSRRATRGRRVHEPVRLLRPRRPAAHQQARRRGADQGRAPSTRCMPDRAAHARQRRPRARLGRHAGRACRPGRPLRLRRRRRSTARARRSRRWSRPRAWSIKERLTLEKARARLLSLGPSVRPERAAEVRRFAQAQIADLHRQPRAAAARRHRRATCASSTASAAGVAIFKLDDKSELDRGRRQRGPAQRQPRPAEGRRADHRAGQGAARPLLAAACASTSQQVWDLAGARCRFGKYLRVAVNGSVPPVAEVLREFPSRRVATEHGDLPQGLTVRLQLHREAATRRARPRRRGALLPDRCGAGALAGRRRTRARRSWCTSRDAARATPSRADQAAFESHST